MKTAKLFCLVFLIEAIVALFEKQYISCLIILQSVVTIEAVANIVDDAMKKLMDNKK
jgi:hypothetical protein